MGYSREYLDKLVEAEQKRKEDAAGIQYEYNTEVHPCLRLTCASLQSVRSCKARKRSSKSYLWSESGVLRYLQEAEQRQAAEEAAKTGDDANDLEKAQDFGRLRTMKVQQARATGVLSGCASPRVSVHMACCPAHASTAFSSSGTPATVPAP